LTEDSRIHRRKSVRNALLLAPVALFPFVLLGVLFLFRSTGQKRAVADAAIYMAQASPRVAAEIGLPIEPGWPVRGHLFEKGADGNADLLIRLNGSRASGTLIEWTQRSHGKWHICSLTFITDGQAPLQLVDPGPSHCEPE